MKEDIPAGANVLNGRFVVTIKNVGNRHTDLQSPLRGARAQGQEEDTTRSQFHHGSSKLNKTIDCIGSNFWFACMDT